MQRFSNICIVILACLPQQGCARNSVLERSIAVSRPAEGRAIIVLGLQDEVKMPEYKFGIVIEKFDQATGKGGDCSRWDRIEADVGKKPDIITYRAFDVPAGSYVWSWNNGEELLASDRAFQISAGEKTYIGDYRRISNIYDKGQSGFIASPGDVTGQSGVVDFQRNVIAAERAMRLSSGSLKLAPVLTEPTAPRAFMCAP